MGFITMGANGPNIHATDTKGEQVVIYSADLIDQMGVLQQRPLTATFITGFSDEHPSGAKARVEMAGYTLENNTFNVDAFGEPSQSFYSDEVLVQENVQELSILYKQAGITFPRHEIKSSKSAFSRFFDAHVTPKARSILTFISIAPVPRV